MKHIVMLIFLISTAAYAAPACCPKPKEVVLTAKDAHLLPLTVTYDAYKLSKNLTSYSIQFDKNFFKEAPMCVISLVDAMGKTTSLTSSATVKNEKGYSFVLWTNKGDHEKNSFINIQSSYNDKNFFVFKVRLKDMKNLTKKALQNRTEEKKAWDKDLNKPDYLAKFMVPKRNA